MKHTQSNYQRIAASVALLAVGGLGRAAVRDVPGGYASITDAVNAATPGDTIRFSSPGAYPSAAATITKSLAFAGPTNGHVTINPPIAGGRVFSIGAGVTVSFDHLTIDGGALTLATDRGAGILNAGNTTLTNCTLSHNSTAASGGAIYNSGGATLSMTNCTLADNTVAGGPTLGGAAISNGGTVVLLNCTVAFNTSSGVAGGLDNRNSTSFTIQNTLVAGNTGGTNPDASGPFASLDYNLIGNGTGATFTGTTAHNHVGTGGSPIDARLGPLQDNGGSTYTVALLPGSPAIDAIPGAAPANFPATDQRDAARPVDGGDGDNIAEGDIGACEAEAPITFYVSTSGSDANTGVTAAQPLRNIVTAINRSALSGVINIAPGSYTENLVLQKSVSLVGTPGAASTTFIKGAGSSALVVYPVTTVYLSDVTITNGSAPNTGIGSGGGVFNEGTLTLERCVVTGNSAAYSGGGIVNYVNGTMYLGDSTVSANTADQAAGIENDGLMVMSGCTVSGNNAGSGAGGGIGNTDSLTITNCTIANNTAGQGGGIYAETGLIYLRNVTISGNSASDGGGIANVSSTSFPNSGLLSDNSVIAANTATTGPDISGEFVSNIGYNFIGSPKDAVITSKAGDQIGVAGSPLKPQLGLLADNGGPTFTMNPNAISPLIDAGPGGAAGPTTFPATDQRGVPRPIGASSDIGAVEYQPRFIVTRTADDTSPGSLRWAIAQANATSNAVISFAIAPTGSAGGVKTIVLSAANGGLPVVSTKTFIDGWSQGGVAYTGNPLIEINGQNVASTFGLNIQGAGSVVRGLAINQFPNNGGGNAFAIGLFNGGANAWIYGCMLGTDPSGTIARGNGQGGIWAAAGGARIGTNLDGVNDAAEANVISSNAFEGILVTSSNNTIAGNYIGTDATGSANLGNGTAAPYAGVRVESGTGNRITRNSIAFNNGLGIDLGGDGVTLNDLGDDDGGANTLQNFPVITGASTALGSTTINGTLNSTPGSTYTVELFHNGAKDPTGYGEGQYYLTSTNVSTDTSGNGTFSVSVPAVAAGEWLTATATNAGGNTSEFSLAFASTGTAFTLSDVARALRLAGGTAAFNTSDGRLNVETTGGSASNVDLRDASRLARKVAGLEPNP